MNPPFPRGGVGRGPPTPSLQVAVLEVSVLEGEAFLLALAPLFIVKIDIGALIF